jgi:hypothetical protein
MFRAMTAGCHWDVEFSLSESGRVQARLLDGLGRVLPATAGLNSAYLNVSAIALRVALASQQNWTNLRTIVLDDPILEMDSLTQSALIDGLEAILSSPHTPWTNLQLIITTWSEDFAVMAAHKLAQLSASGELGRHVEGLGVRSRRSRRASAPAVDLGIKPRVRGTVNAAREQSQNTRVAMPRIRANGAAVPMGA